MSRHEEEVVRLIRLRADMGLQKYGVTMERDDLSEVDWLKHARDEAMDWAVYLTRLIDDKTKT